MCQDSLDKLTVGDGRVPTDWGPAGTPSHPDAGHPTEKPPEAAPEQGQEPGTGKITLSLVKLQDGRAEVTLIKVLSIYAENFEGQRNLTQVDDS